jgi:hypothetical protein
VKPSFFPDNIRSLLEARKKMQAEKNKKYISITSEIYDLIMNSQRVMKS